MYSGMNSHILIDIDMADRPISLDFNQACFTKFAAILPFYSCKNTTGALSLSSVKFFCVLQVVSRHFNRFSLQSQIF